MRKKLLLTASQEFNQNKRLYTSVIFLFFAGIIIGTITAVSASSFEEAKSYFDRFLSAYTLQGIGNIEVVRLSLLGYLRLAFILWCSGWFMWLLPVGALQIAFKGFSTGYTIACLMRCYQWRGFIMAFTAIMPQSVVLIPAICFFGVYHLKFYADRRLIVKGNAAGALKKQIYGHNLVMTGIFLIMLLLCAVIESYAVPAFFKPICGLFV